MNWQQTAYFLIGLLIGVVFHEYMHGRVADMMGDHTARNSGRLTLNPIPHIDPFGTILLPIALILLSGGAFSFGYAKPVPVNPYFMKKPRRDMMLVALAGPLTNFSLAAAFTILGLILRLSFHIQFSAGIDGRLISSKGGTWADLFLLIFSIAAINVILGIFNLIPIPPLDGSHILEYFLSPKAQEVYESVSRYGFVMIFGLLALLYFAGGSSLSFLNPVFRVIETGVFGKFVTVF